MSSGGLDVFHVLALLSSKESWQAHTKFVVKAPNRNLFSQKRKEDVSLHIVGLSEHECLFAFHLIFLLPIATFALREICHVSRS